MQLHTLKEVKKTMPPPVAPDVPLERVDDTTDAVVTVAFAAYAGAVNLLTLQCLPHVVRSAMCNVTSF
jgi:hypothetical protein